MANKTNDDITNGTFHLATMNNQQNLKEPVYSVTNNATTSQSVTHYNSPRRSSRIKKPTSFNNDSIYINPPLTRSSQEVDKNKILIEKKETKEITQKGIQCCAKYCQNKYPSKNVSFFGFPKNLSLRKIWIENCGIESLVDPNSTIKCTYKVCGCHFENNMFFNTPTKNRIKVNAVPTIFNNKDISHCSFAENETLENLKDSSTINDTRIIESLNLQNTEDKQEQDNNEDNETTQKNRAIYICCLPGCIYSADSLNNKGNRIPKSIATFTPSSIEKMNEWSSLFGLRLTMESRVCERHFKSKDIFVHGTFTTETGLGNVKSLNYNAVPLKNQKRLKRSRVNNRNEDITIKKTRKYAGKSNDFSKFSELPEDKNIEKIDSDPSTSTLNTIINLNNESVDSLSNITPISSMRNNSPSSFEDILPKNSDNNTQSISSLPNAQISATQSTEKIEPIYEIKDESFDDIPQTTSTDDPNTVKFPSESNFEQTLNITPFNNSASINSIKENKQVPTGVEKVDSTVFDPLIEIPKELNNDTPQTSNSSLSNADITVEVNPKVIEDVPQTTNSLESNMDNSLSVSSSIAQYEQVSGIQSTESNFSTKSKSIGNVPSYQQNKQISITELNKKSILSNLKTDLEQAYSSLFDNTSSMSIFVGENNYQSAQMSATQSTEKTEPIYEIKDESFDDIPQTISTDDPNTVKFPSKSNFEQTLNITPFNNSASINSIKEDKQVSTGVEKIDTIIFNPLIELFDELNYESNADTTVEVNSELINNVPQTSNFSQSNADTTVEVNSELINDLPQTSNSSQSNVDNFMSVNSFRTPNIPSLLPGTSTKLDKMNSFTNLPLETSTKEPITVENFINNSKSVRPNSLWQSFYDYNQNSVVFYQQDTSMRQVKNVYFNNSFVPSISVGGKKYKFKRAIKTNSDLEILLENIHDISFCPGYNGYAHKSCIGFFDNSSKEFKVCGKCQMLVENKDLLLTDTAIRTCRSQFILPIVDMHKRFEDAKRYIVESRKRKS